MFGCTVNYTLKLKLTVGNKVIELVNLKKKLYKNNCYY